MVRDIFDCVWELIINGAGGGGGVLVVMGLSGGALGAWGAKNSTEAQDVRLL